MLQHVHALLPDEELVYFADSGFAPYGDKPESVIVERALAIAAFLMTYQVKAIVVACNTATAAAIAGLRAHYPQLKVVGVEPGLKPAAALTQSKIVGVLATERTLSSDKFLTLQKQTSESTQVRFLTQACTGLADQIEKGELQSRETAAMVQRYVAPLIAEGADTIVLGCTHYPFVQSLIEQVIAATDKEIALIDTGNAVARQLKRLLMQHHLLRPATGEPTILSAYTTGSNTALAQAFSTLLGLKPPIREVKLRTG